MNAQRFLDEGPIRRSRQHDLESESFEEVPPVWESLIVDHQLSRNADCHAVRIGLGLDKSTEEHVLALLEEIRNLLAPPLLLGAGTLRLVLVASIAVIEGLPFSLDDHLVDITVVLAAVAGESLH